MSAYRPPTGSSGSLPPRPPQRAQPRHPVRRVIVGLIIFLLVVGFGYFGYLVARLWQAVQAFTPGPDHLSSTAAALVSGPPTQRQAILLLGTDYDPRAKPGSDYAKGLGGRTDVMMLAIFDDATHRITLLTLPRDTALAMDRYGRQKINAAAVLGGPSYAQQIVERLTGIPTLGYVTFNFLSFQKAVDAVGGVDITLDHPIVDAALHANFPAGRQHVDGEDALKLVRFRHDAQGDEGRTARQRQIVEAILTKVMTPSGIGLLPGLLEAVSTTSSNNLSAETLAELVHANGVHKPRFVQELLPGENRYVWGGWYYLIDLSKTRNLLDRLWPDHAPVDRRLLPDGYTVS